MFAPSLYCYRRHHLMSARNLFHPSSILLMAHSPSTSSLSHTETTPTSSTSTTKIPIPPLLSSPEALVKWSTTIRNNVKVRRSLSRFLVEFYNSNHNENNDDAKNNTLSAIDRRLPLVTCMKSISLFPPRSWATALSICQATIDVSIQQRLITNTSTSTHVDKNNHNKSNKMSTAIELYPQDVAANIFPVFSHSSNQLWEHALRFHHQFVDQLKLAQTNNNAITCSTHQNNNIYNNNTSNFFGGASSSVTALIECLIRCNKHEQVLEAIDHHCDFIPSGHVGYLMNYLLGLLVGSTSSSSSTSFPTSDSPTCGRRVAIAERGVLLASVYLSRGGDLKNISRSLKKILAVLNDRDGVAELDSNNNSNIDVIPHVVTDDDDLFRSKQKTIRRIEHKLRDYAREVFPSTLLSVGPKSRSSSNTIEDYFNQEFLLNNNKNNEFHHIDHRLARTIFSHLVLADEFTLTGELKQDKIVVNENLRRYNNNKHENSSSSSWQTALRLAAKVNSLSLFSEDGKVMKNTISNSLIESVERSLSAREVLAAVTAFSDDRGQTSSYFKALEFLTKLSDREERVIQTVLDGNTDDDNAGDDNDNTLTISLTKKRLILCWVRCQLLQVQIQYLIMMTTKKKKSDKLSDDFNFVNDHIDKVLTVMMKINNNNQSQHGELRTLQSNLIAWKLWIRIVSSSSLQNNKNRKREELEFIAKLRSAGASTERLKKLISDRLRVVMMVASSVDNEEDVFLTKVLGLLEV